MFDRRFFLKKLSLLTIPTAATAQIIKKDPCIKKETPNQSMGPFYPEVLTIEKDADLTQLKGHKQKAKGQYIQVSGIVQDEFCKPIENAIVEIWQACYSGRYNHPSDTSNEKLDPHFQYYAMMKTDGAGIYSFKTVIPGAYNVSLNWMRPPHIHYKVSLKGYKPLITQLYFHGHKLNKNDGILNSLSLEEKKKVIVDFKKGDNDFLQGKFHIHLKKY
tara:strand:- start:54 stop:704 length:651 start_codon:yes stop_codon:yes gene_type:complete